MIETVIFFFTVGKNYILSNPVSSYRLDGGKKPAKDDDRLQNALSVRSGLKLFFFFKPYVFEGCYFYYVLIIVRGSAFWLERLCNICAFNVMQNTTCMRGEQKVPPPSAGLDVAFLHNTRLSPKTTISLMIVMRMRDETHCSAALSCAVLLMIPQPRGRCQGVNF